MPHSSNCEKHLTCFRYLPYEERQENLLPSISCGGIYATHPDVEVCSQFGHGTSHPLQLSKKQDLIQELAYLQ